jgi:hypothetical protein
MSTLLLDRPASSPTVVAGDPILLHAFARRGRPLCVGDLLRAMAGTGARVSDVMDLLAAALTDGLLAPHGHRTDADGRLVGPLLYGLTDEGHAVVEADRLAV